MVGYIGDGINDAPSLHTADVGISVMNGVDVAKDAAKIILLEKDLAVLNEGVIEGRRCFANIMKYIIMSTSSNFGNMFSMAAASLFLPFLPMLPTQILLNNFLYDTSQVAVPGDNVDPALLHKPKRWQIGFIRQFMTIIGPISSIYDFLTFGVLLWLFHAATNAPLFRTGWFVESLATQTLVVFVIRTAGNPFKSRPSGRLLIGVVAVSVAGAVLPYTPLGAAAWVYSVAAVVAGRDFAAGPDIPVSGASRQDLVLSPACAALTARSQTFWQMFLRNFNSLPPAISDSPGSARYSAIAMATVAQIQANRLNALRSTGPRSGAGKAASRFNALKSGVDARSLVIPGEDPAELEALTLDYRQTLRPVGPLEDFLVETLVAADWNRRRYARSKPSSCACWPPLRTRLRRTRSARFSLPMPPKATHSRRFSAA